MVRGSCPAIISFGGTRLHPGQSRPRYLFDFWLPYTVVITFGTVIRARALRSLYYAPPWLKDFILASFGRLSVRFLAICSHGDARRRRHLLRPRPVHVRARGPLQQPPWHEGFTLASFGRTLYLTSRRAPPSAAAQRYLFRPCPYNSIPRLIPWPRLHPGQPRPYLSLRLFAAHLHAAVPACSTSRRHNQLPQPQPYILEPQPYTLPRMARGLHPGQLRPRPVRVRGRRALQWPSWHEGFTLATLGRA